MDFLKELFENGGEDLQVSYFSGGQPPVAGDHGKVPPYSDGSGEEVKMGCC